jgi:hypothetical protein
MTDNIRSFHDGLLPSGKTGPPEAAGSIVYRYRRFIVKENTQKMESSQFCLFHFLWYNGHRKRQLTSVVGKWLSHNFLNLKGAFQAIGWLFSIATF